MRLEKNNFEILPGSWIEIRGCPLAHTYRYILYLLSGKLTSKRASWNYAKLAPVQVLSKTVCQPLQVPHTLVVFSFHQFEWNEQTKDDEPELFWTIKTSGCQFTHKKNIEPVFVKYYALSICLLLNMAKFTQCLISTKPFGLCRKAKHVIYSSSPFQTASSNLADKVEMPFAKVHNSRKIWQHLLKR